MARVGLRAGAWYSVFPKSLPNEPGFLQDFDFRDTVVLQSTILEPYGTLRGLDHSRFCLGHHPHLVDNPYYVVQQHLAVVVLICPGELYADTVASFPVG